MITLRDFLNGDNWQGVLNAFWSIEMFVVLAYIASPRVRRWIKARYS